jgi:hypothetical protein
MARATGRYCLAKLAAEETLVVFSHAEHRGRNASDPSREPDS